MVSCLFHDIELIWKNGHAFLYSVHIDIERVNAANEWDIECDKFHISKRPCIILFII